MPPSRIPNEALSDETRRLMLSLIQSLKDDLDKFDTYFGESVTIRGIQITLDNWHHADQPPTIDARYV